MVHMDITQRPKNLRTILLAYPKRITNKYRPPKYIPGKSYSGVSRGAINAPPASWRLNQLSVPNTRLVTPKYVPVPETSLTGLSPATLAGEGTSRSYDLSRPLLRHLRLYKRDYKHLGPRIMKNIDKKIGESWNCLYNYYVKGLYDLEEKRKRRLRARKARKGTKVKSAKEIKEEREKRFKEWVAKAALPKKVHKPRPLRKRKIVNLEKIRVRMNQLAEPRFVTNKYIRPSIDPHYVDPNKVPDAAKQYVPSERVLEISRPPAHRVEKIPEIIPGKVNRAALTCPVSPRFAELAVPKKKAAEKDNDLKENPFMVSPNAKKYKATARILELSKPVER